MPYQKTIEFKCKVVLVTGGHYIMDSLHCAVVMRSKCLNENQQVVNDIDLNGLVELFQAQWSGSAFIHKKELDDNPQMKTGLLKVITTLIPPTKEYLAKELYDEVQAWIDKNVDKANGLELVKTRVTVADISAEYSEED